MATTIYNAGLITLVDGTELYITPLKIKYMRDFMKKFSEITKTSNDDEAISTLVECALITMKQYFPKIKTIEDLEDNFDLPTIYELLNLSAGIRLKHEEEEKTIKQQTEKSDSTWENLDLAKLESEVFLLGIWKDYEELETSLSMPELMATLESKRDLDYHEKKFLAAIQGVDLDGATNSDKGQKEWEDMKARVFSGGATSDSNDVLSLQGQNAKKAGFGIGMGLDYEDARDPALMKN